MASGDLLITLAASDLSGPDAMETIRMNEITRRHEIEADLAQGRAAIDVMVSGRAKTITDAAEAAGLSREHLSCELSNPHIAEFLKQRVG